MSGQISGDTQYYSAVPLALRLYFMAKPSSLLEPATRRTIEALAKRWLSYRSFVARGLGSVQPIDGSENHDMLRKGSYLLAAQVLVACGRGDDHVPSDNQTAAAHLEAWESYFVQYFRYHARGFTARGLRPQVDPWEGTAGGRLHAGSVVDV